MPVPSGTPSSITPKDIRTLISNTLGGTMRKMSEFSMNGEIHLLTPFEIVNQMPITYIITFIIQIIIVWAILFKLNTANMQKNYMEVSVILLTSFIIFKISLMLFARNSNPGEMLSKIKTILGNFIKTDGIHTTPEEKGLPTGKFLLFETLSIGLGSLILLAVLTVFMLIVRYFTNDNVIGFVGYMLLFIFIIFSIFIISAIIYNYKVSDDVKKANVVLFIETIFGYIPCLFFDIMGWFKNEVSTTSKLGLIIAGIIGVYIGFVYINKLLVKVVDNKYLLTGPVYINKSIALSVKSTNEDANDEDANDEDTETETNPNYKYSTSFWFWITPQPPGTNSHYTKYTNIFTYDDRPLVDYNESTDTLRVSCRESSTDIKELYTATSIPKQTWNHFVVNYLGGSIDIFINGELVSSTPNITPYMDGEDIIIGKKKGIDGGIRDVDYSSEIFNPRGIKLIYYIKKLMFQLE
jgi:hypothetical protein